MRVPTLTDAALAPSQQGDPSQPLVTFYDDATGERTELSGVTLANWAAKTANLLRDELGVQPGDAVVVDLPPHWQTVAVLLGAWWVGAEVRTRADADAAVAFSTPESAAEHDNTEVVAVPLDAFALSIADLPIGVTDFGPAVRVHGDVFRPTGTAAAALDGLTVSAVTDAATAAAESDGLRPGDRVLNARDRRGHEAVVGDVLAPLLAGCSLVLVTHRDPVALDTRATSENVTVRLY